MLVSALAGREHVLKAYEEAIKEGTVSSASGMQCLLHQSRNKIRTLGKVNRDIRSSVPVNRYSGRGSMDFKYLLDTEEYDFIRNNKRLGRHVILLAMGGSYSYGTNNADSDIDIRGITLNRKSDLIGMTQFEQYVDDKTDTVIYAFNKMISLLLSCNPNTCELQGNEEIPVSE